MKGVMAAVLLAVSGMANAEQFIATYEGFYDRMAVVDKGQYRYAEVNFYLVDYEHGAPCPVESGKIVTEQQEFPLLVSDEGQLLLPFDKQIEKDKGVIVANPRDNKSCQLRLQIESKRDFPVRIATQTLYSVHDEFRRLLGDLSGFFVRNLLSFLLPEQKGLWLEFASETLSQSGLECEGKRCRLAVPGEWNDSGEMLELPAKPLRMTPWIEK